LAKHPQVSIDLVGTAAPLDLSRREVEIAIRATRKPPEASFGRKVCDFRFAVYGSPDYVECHRDVPLQELDWCLLQGIVNWLVPTVWKKVGQGEARTVLTSGSAVPLLSAVADGLGVTAMPCYLGDADERLVRFAPPFPQLTLQLWVLTHPDLKGTVRVKALMEFLYDFLKERSDLFAGQLVD
jgi:DNA-binding transcriptional LysR family regulator